VLLAALSTAALAQAAPPRVVRTDPAPDAVDLAAGARELVVTFDQPMARAGWSVVGGGPHFPRDAGAMGWRDARTFVWPVQLRADQDYAERLAGRLRAHRPRPARRRARRAPVALRRRDRLRAA
jgi:hypothetical protein